MLRLSHDRKLHLTQSLFRQVLPHIALVFLVACYLLFGAKMFDHFERIHDEQFRINSKIRLMNEIKRIISLTECQQKLNCDIPRTPISFDANSNFEFQDFSGDGSGDLVLTKIDKNRIKAKRREIINLIQDLLSQWEDAVRNYDMRANRMFKDDFLIHEENISNWKTNYGDDRWTFPASILFAFTVITTIGYGNLTPNTFEGRLFCMIYGVIGIPLTMLAIANIGRFLSDGAGMLMDRIRREFAYRRLKRRIQIRNMRRPSRLAGQFFREVIKRSDIALKPLPQMISHVCLLLCFMIYIIMGALCLPLWEDMKFFDACYFSFVTITTVGFGDIVPRRHEYLFPTLVYVTIGLAITTLTIEIFGGFLRQIHYLGSKIKGAKNVFIWFGNKMLTVQDLVTAVARQYGIPQTEIETLNANLDNVIKQTVEEKEKEAKEKKVMLARRHSTKDSYIRLAPLFADAEFRYIDEDSLSTQSDRHRLRMSI